MRGRRTVWSDAKVQELTKQFVLATDEVWRLQGGRDPAVWRARGGKDPECIAFQDMAAKGHYGPGAGSKQGIYVCTPSGEFLASINSNRPDAVAQTLARGLATWRALPSVEKDEQPGKIEPEHRFESLRPKDGLSLTTTLRYLPQDDDPAKPKHRDYNHDYLWFSADEARQFLPAKPTGAAAQLKKGAKQTLPPRLFQRIACLNLVDAVRGETRAFQKAEGSIETEVTAIDGDVVELRLSGKTVARGTPRRRGLYAPLGIKTQLLGTARYDLKQRKFVAFELVGKGLRWTGERRRRGGRGDGRGRRRGRVRAIGWFFTLTPERKDGFDVAPTNIRQYGVDWAQRSGR